MKKFILSAAAALLLPLAAQAAIITTGSVPGKINYQGRLERDNAPITGPVHLRFRLFNSATASNTGGSGCGASGQPCVWESAEIVVQAAQGIFSADLTPPLDLFTSGFTLYLEVQVESDTLSPREPLNSVAYALVAKKLEDGAGIEVTTLTAAYQVYLASAPGSSVAVGSTIRPGTKLTVDGDIEMINGGVLRFPGGSFMTTAEIGTAYGGAITNSMDASVIADNDSNGSGNILFGIGSVFGAAEKARIMNNGDFGINTKTPMGKLDVNGALFVGNEGITDRTLDGEVNINGDLSVSGGKVTGANLESISLGEVDNVITFTSDAAEKMRINSDGRVGIGLAAPASSLHVAGDVRSNTGVRGGAVSIGGYAGDWTGLANEVRAQNNTHLLLQQTNSYNVGIGTNTPREKLHVRGSVRADFGVEAATAAFSGDVRVNGDFRANGDNKQVYLTSTTIYGDSKIYGDLLVTGGIGSMAGIPAYKSSSQTFTGVNTFLGQVTVSSDILAANRLGAGVLNFDFAGSRYLQVGDNLDAFPNDNAMAYLVGGAAANAKLNFYRGAAESARFETQDGPNLALVINGKTRTLTDSTYHRIQNSVVWISTGFAGTPAIFVSSADAIVGIGTAVSNPNWRLTVDGNLRISGAGNALIFPDGSSMATSSATSASGISTNGNAVVQSDADQINGGDVILRAGAVDGLVLKSGGNIGIGTLSPVARLNVRGGDLVLGTPVNPYGNDSVEDLVVGGNIAFDGELLQRSVSEVKLSSLRVGGNVYLSTGTGKRTGIGNDSPGYSLDVTGDINASGALRTGTTARISNLGVVGSGGANATWDGVIINVDRGGTGGNTFTAGGILLGNGASDIGVTLRPTQGQLLIGKTAGAPALAQMTGTLHQITVANGDGSIGLSLPQDIDSLASPTFSALTLTNPLAVPNGGTGVNTLAAGGLLFGNDASAVGVLPTLGAGGLIIGDGAGAPSTGTLAGTASQVIVANGPGRITLSLPQNIDTTAVPQFAGVTTAYLKPVGGDSATAFQIRKADGTTNILDVDTLLKRIGINNAAPTATLDVTGGIKTTTFQMTSGGNNNYVLASDASGNGTWKSISGSGIGDDWGSQTVSRDSTLSGNGTGLSQLGINLGNINTWTGAQTFSGGLTGTLTGSITGNAATVTTNANLTGQVTSVGNATTIASLPAISGANLTNLTAANINAGTAGISISGNANTATTATTANALANTAAAGLSAINAINTSASGAVAADHGGTGLATLTANNVLIGNGTGNVLFVAGQSVIFTVAKSTDPVQGCRKLTYDKGVLTNVTDAPCNP